MRKHILVLMTAILVLALATVAMAADPHVGTWKLNLAKSMFNPGPGNRSTTHKLEAMDNGIKSVTDVVASDGKAIHIEFSVKYDGKDYPVTGMPSADTMAITKIDANNWDEVFKKDGKEVSRGRNSISKDGKTMTITSKGKNAKGQDSNNTVVCDKQ